jgi:hypothetical protein
MGIILAYLTRCSPRDRFGLAGNGGVIVGARRIWSLKSLHGQSLVWSSPTPSKCQLDPKPILSWSRIRIKSTLKSNRLRVIRDRTPAELETVKSHIQLQSAGTMIQRDLSLTSTLIPPCRTVPTWKALVFKASSFSCYIRTVPRKISYLSITAIEKTFSRLLCLRLMTTDLLYFQCWLIWILLTDDIASILAFAVVFSSWLLNCQCLLLRSKIQLVIQPQSYWLSDWYFVSFSMGSR